MNRSVAVGASVVFLASLLLYWLTLAPTVTFVDSGELILAARTCGVAHPPGFPLYVILAHLATLIPAGNDAQRVHIASALFAAASAGVLTLLTGEALLTARQLASRGPKRERKGSGKKRLKRIEPASNTGDIGLIAAAVASGLLLAFSRTLWSYATIAEVYTLNTLLVVLAFFLLFRWRRRSIERSTQRVGQNREQDRWLYAAAFAFGLSLCVHHVTSALTLPALGIVVYSTEGARFFRSKRLLYAALFAAAGLSIYVYLPIAASASPLFNWGNPSDLERFWWHVTGRQYQVFLSGEAVISGEAKELALLVWREFGPSGLPLALASALLGVAIAFKRDRSLLFFVIAVVLANLAYTLNYKIAEDKDAYYLPVFVVAALAAGYGAEWAVSAADRARFWGGSSIAVAAAVIALPAIALIGNLPYNNRSRYFIARDYVENMAGTIEKRGMLLTLDWQVYSPLLYLREVEAYRRDIIGIDVNLLRRSWYFDYLKLSYPELMEATRSEVELFLEDLRNWEHDPAAYERNVTLNRRISERYLAVLKAMVASCIDGGSVYVTEEIASGRDPQNAELARELTSMYQLVPEGLAFKVTRDRGFQMPAEPELELRGLTDGSIRFSEKDVVREKVLRVYTTMLSNRGRYLAAYGRHEGAIRAFQECLALDGGFAPAVAGLAESKRALEAKAKK